MTSNELLYVKTIADEHSITRAAGKLHISQPSLTQSIQRIEQNLGTALFVRTSSGTYLTETGKQYYAMAEEILTIYRNFLQSMQDSGKNVRGTLSIGASWYISTYFLTNIISRYCQDFPLVDVRLTEKNTAELELPFNQGSLDLIFVHRCSFEKKPFPKTQIVKPIKRERLCIVAAAGLGLSNLAHTVKTYARPVLDLADIRQIPVVRFREVQRIRQLVDYVLDKAQIFPPTLLYTYGFQNALELAASSNAITFLPETFLNGPAASGYPVEIFDVDRNIDLYWDICMRYRSQEHFSAPMEHFLNMAEHASLS